MQRIYLQILSIFRKPSGPPVYLCLLFPVSDDGACALKLVKEEGQEKISCKTSKALIHCSITCQGKNHGWFTCEPSGKWNRPLPTCAKRMGKSYLMIHYMIIFLFCY